ncbi:MAG: hypothetical protein J0I08_03180 [Rhizobiales bacterium]|nr:hypothetical protein [Hyphomicrobiales bacterium]
MQMRVAIRDISLFERPVQFVRPFRFGVVRVDSAPQAFVRVELEIEGGRTTTGASAEMMMPKWFDKRPDRTPTRTIDDLRRSLAIARELYLSDTGFDTTFGLHAARIASQVRVCSEADIPPLAASFGPAEIDKAILDALLRGLDLDVFQGLAANVAGIDNRLMPDLADSAITQFLAATAPKPRIAIRHTVGLDDALEGRDGLAAVIRDQAVRYLKLKLGGDTDVDAARLGQIAATIEAAVNSGIPIDGISLDANEQYADLAALSNLLDRLDRDPALAPIANRLIYIEQPMPRDAMLTSALGSLARYAMIIDEADGSYDAFRAAKDLGYRGVSSKACKGLYKSILNAARAATWSSDNQSFLITAEDLTCQAGLGVQQDIALGALIGVGHAERNGHHYVEGFGGAPMAEQERFLAAHPDLYVRTSDGIRLAAADGSLATSSLVTPGFASRVHPDWSALQPLQSTTRRIPQEQFS